MAQTKDLGLILDAKIPIIVIESPDERRVLALLLRFAIHRGLSFYEWSVTKGLHLGGFGSEPKKGDELTEPLELLQHIANRKGPALYALCDFHPYIVDEPKERSLSERYRPGIRELEEHGSTDQSRVERTSRYWPVDGNLRSSITER